MRSLCMSSFLFCRTNNGQRLDKLKCFEAISVQTKTVSERERACVLTAAVCDGDRSGCLALERWARASQRSLAAPEADLQTPGFWGGFGLRLLGFSKTPAVCYFMNQIVSQHAFFFLPSCKR